jgi:hypothetical protein
VGPIFTGQWIWDKQRFPKRRRQIHVA